MKKREKELTGLVGHWFHQYKGDEIGWQGVVLHEVSPQIYLVQLFSWFDGAPIERRLVGLSEMREHSWRFYPDGPSADEAYKKYSTQHEAKKRQAQNDAGGATS